MAYGKALEQRAIRPESSTSRRSWITSGGAQAVRYWSTGSGEEKFGVTQSQQDGRNARMHLQAVLQKRAEDGTDE
jgi:hypothetical protein